MDVNNFYLYISRLCEAEGISERKLSEIISGESNYVSSTKAQKRLPPLEKIEKIAETFGMALSKFIQGLEENDEFTALCAAKIKRLTQNMSREDKIFLNRYTDYLTPEAFASDISRLRKTIRDLKE